MTDKPVKYALMAQRKVANEGPLDKALVMWVGSDKEKLRSDAARLESDRVHYWVVLFAEQFPNAQPS